MHRILLLLSLYLSLAAAWGFSKSSREASSSGSGGSDAYKSPKKHPPPRFLTRDCKNVRIMEYNQAYFLEAQCTRKGKFSMLGTVTSTLELDRCLGWDKASNNFVAQR
ncbi:hypothetical protein BDV25DRAFT_143853 [Aspergillus avenaceus]|uniref:Cyanovirin-N domain-containing protein n=1 Tax=Aspergillus avenaceus TaxID=36643 RepID=A0A5N6TIU3_ASPAV|nr:hypothetical protein BDV25DRAFT_143853 [Aspergillus avenaceus]